MSSHGSRCVVAGGGFTGLNEGTAGATVVDLAGKTVMPGMINSHAHIDPDISVTQPPNRDEMKYMLPDNTTYVAAHTALTADGGVAFELPPCTVKCVVTTATTNIPAARPAIATA